MVFLNINEQMVLIGTKAYKKTNLINGIEVLQEFQKRCDLLIKQNKWD
jgi:hypothetical protein